MKKFLSVFSVIAVLLTTMLGGSYVHAAADNVYGNWSFSTIGANFNSGAASLTVAGGDGVKFPATGNFNVTIYSASCASASSCGNREILTINRSSGDVFNVVSRALESTITPSTWYQGDKIFASVTAGELNGFSTQTGTETLTNKTLTLPIIGGTAGTTAGQVGYSAGILQYGDGSVIRSLIDLSQTQTLTNKTLTAPVLSGAVTGSFTGIPGRLLNIQYLTSGTSYTPTAGTNSIIVQLVGGGGGGGGAPTSNTSSGGGSGAWAQKRFTGIGAGPYTYAIGAFGTGGASTGANGTAGTSTTFTGPGAVTVTAPGGSGGIWGAPNLIGGLGASVATNGDINTGGTQGQGGFTSIAGNGAASPFGSGGNGLVAGAGSAGLGYGSGGGGGSNNNAGGNGAPGIIVVYEYSS